MADTRKDKRTAVALKVRFKSATVDEFIEQYSTDVSRGGIFVKSGRPMKIGTLLKFQFQLKDESTLIRGVGRVVWTREDDSDPESPPGMGIKFIKMDDASKDVLNRVLSSGDEEKKSRFDVGPGLGKGETEADDAHPSDPPEGNFFPSTSSESDMPPPEDRTAVRHASEFLAGALSGVSDADAAREAEEGAEQARKRSEEIDAQRAAEAKKSAEPSILVDPSLESERPPAPDAEGEPQEQGEKKPDPERDIDTEVGTPDQLERLAKERAERKEAQQKAAEAALESGSITPPATEEAEVATEKDETQAASQAAPAPKPDKSEGGSRGVWVALVVAAAVVFGYLATRGPDQAEPPAPPEPAAAVEPAPTQPMAAEQPVQEEEGAEALADDEEAVDTEDEAAGDDLAEDGDADGEAAADDEAEASPAAAAEAEAGESESEGAGDGSLVRLRLLTVPPGGEVFVDGESVGTAPVRVEAVAGEPLELRAKLEGRDEVTQTITPSTDGDHRLRMVLPRLPYVLTVVSKPEGATVLAAGKRIETPGDIDLGIPSGGRVRVRVRHPGYVQATRILYVGQFEQRDGAMRQTLEVELTEKAGRAPTAPVQPAAKPSAAEKPAAAPKPQAKPDPTPAQSPKPEPDPEPAPDPDPAPQPVPKPSPDPPAADPDPAPQPAPKPEPDSLPMENPYPEAPAE